MKKKKGFIATSLIYSFFLVFLILMMTILSRAVNNRILVNEVKNNTREDISEDSDFVNIKGLEKKEYLKNSEVVYANETWQVLSDSDDSVTLLLKRGLTPLEVQLNSNLDINVNFYYEDCRIATNEYCKVRSCITEVSNEYCYAYNGIEKIPTFKPSLSDMQDKNYAETLVSRVLNNWFNRHPSLSKSTKSLNNMNFSDGILSYNGFVRLPSKDEMDGYELKDAVTPFHLLEVTKETASSKYQINIYNDGVTASSITTSAYIRPVIEVKKE